MGFMRNPLVSGTVGSKLLFNKDKKPQPSMVTAQTIGARRASLINQPRTGSLY